MGITRITVTTDQSIQHLFNMYSLYILLAVLVSVMGLNPCPGDTRGDRRCNHDSTHRVCAKIGIAGTSFWEFTGQRSWCGTRGYYWGPYGYRPRCPPSKPTWCICKWAAARWIAGEGCEPMCSLTVTPLMFVI